MNIGSYNKALAQQIKKSLDFAFLKEMDDQELFFCCDTDSVRYKTIAKTRVVKLLFFAADLKKVWEYCHQHLIKAHYEHFQVGLKHEDHADCLEIVVDQQCLTTLNQNFKDKQETGITSGKKKFHALFEFLSKKMASIKRHFFASPYEMMIHAIDQNKNKKTNHHLPNLTYNIKAGGIEKVWIVFQKIQFTIFFGINFEDRSEQQLCKIFLSQMVDCKKHINNCPGISTSDSEMPMALVQAFPDEKNKKYSFSNGITSITMFAYPNMKAATMATYLANFRNYAYYHIQAQKCYLHSRILRRITTLHKDLSHAKLVSDDHK